MTPPMMPVGPTEAYLAAFAARLAVSPRRRRRVQAEAADHLRDVAEALAASGVPGIEAEREALERFGDPETAAAAFGSTLCGRVWRAGRRVVRRRPPVGARSSEVVSDPEPQRGRWPAATCDVCGAVVTPAERFVDELSGIGEIETPVTVIAHRACYEMGKAILALRAMPLKSTAPPARSH